MEQGQLASGDTHFDFPAHDLLIFFDGALKVFVEWSEFGDLAGKAGGLPTIFARNGFQGQAGQRPDTGILIRKVIPERIEFTAQGGNDAKAGNNDAVGVGHWENYVKRLGKGLGPSHKRESKAYTSGADWATKPESSHPAWT